MAAPSSTRLELPRDSAIWSKPFVLGAATASFQIEGDAENRLANIWDRFCAVPGNIADGSDGRVACDHVGRLAEDIQLMGDLNLDAYRFSISWGRILDEDGQLNPKGLDFYQRLIEGLHDRDIKPWATLYHWDLPLYLDDRGGWLNRDTAYRFQEYVDRVATALGDGVSGWMTINEPMVSAYLGYSLGIHAPGHQTPDEYPSVAHHLLLAHGLGMQALEVQVPNAPRGLSLNLSRVQSASSSLEDRRAARQADLMLFRRFLDPVLKGHYSEELIHLDQECPPRVEPGDLEVIAQPLDFLGINYYTRAIYKAHDHEGFEECQATGDLTDMGWEIYPSGLTDLLVELDRDYSLPPVYITENGAAFADVLEEGKVHDGQRIAYIQDHLLAIDEAMRKGVDVRGLFYWSLMDNFEWAEGYLKRFGIVHVDYKSLTRTIKDSGLAYGRLCRERAERWAGQQAGLVGD